MRDQFQYLRATKANRKVLFVEFTEKHAVMIFDLLDEAGFLVEKITQEMFDERQVTLNQHKIPDCFAITMLPEIDIKIINHAIESSGLTQRGLRW